MPPKILLASTLKWPSLARYAGGFVAAGCFAEASAPAGAPAFLSQYVSRVYPYQALAPFQSLRRAITLSDPDLIVACDDRSVQQLVQLHQFERGGSPVAAVIEKSLGNMARYPALLSRYQCLKVLEAAGVRIPETHPASSEADVRSALRLLGTPVVVKADGSWGGDGVAIARTEDEALAAFRRFAKPPSRLRSLFRAAKRRDPHHLAMAVTPRGAEVCLQRFIPGSLAASAFAAWGGNIAASFHYDILVADKVIGPPNVIKRIDCSQMEFAAKVTALEFGLTGLHGIDYIRDTQGDIYVLEVNPRATHGGALPFGEGRDLPAGLAGALTGRSTGMRSPVDKDIVALFPREWRRDPSSEYLKTGFHDVPWDDPAILRRELQQLGIGSVDEALATLGNARLKDKEPTRKTG